MDTSKETPRRLTTLLMFGFASGLPLGLSGATLQAWYTTAGISTLVLGVLTLVGQPYVYKFLWAPFLDRFQLPWLSRRLDWALCCQLFLVVILIAMSFLSPTDTPYLLAGLGLCLAFFSATQDVAIDAYRTDLLNPKERGLGNGVHVTGYRLALVVSGGVALIFAEHLGFQNTYLLMAGLLSLSIIITLRAPILPPQLNTPETLHAAVILPFKNLLQQPKIYWLLTFVVLYKLGDAFALSLTTPFLIRGMGFSLTEVGSMQKIGGLSASIVGVLMGGWLLPKIGLYRALLSFGFLQALSNLSFLALIAAGPKISVLLSVVLLENFCGGLGTAAFLSWLMSLCHKEYSATQFALLSALTAVGRVFIGPSAGFVAEYFNWEVFFWVSAIAALPGLVILSFLFKSDSFQLSAPLLSESR